MHPFLSSQLSSFQLDDGSLPSEMLSSLSLLPTKSFHQTCKDGGCGKRNDRVLRKLLWGPVCESMCHVPSTTRPLVIGPDLHSHHEVNSLRVLHPIFSIFAPVLTTPLCCITRYATFHVGNVYIGRFRPSHEASMKTLVAGLAPPLLRLVLPHQNAAESDVGR